MSKEQLDMQNALQRFLKAEPKDRETAWREYLILAVEAIFEYTPIH